MSALSPSDAPAFHRSYFEHGAHFVEISNFLRVAEAQALLEWLTKKCALWGLRFSDGTKILGVPPDLYATCGEREKRQIGEAACRAARTGFAFLREEFWGSWIDASKHEVPGSIIADVAHFLGGGSFSAFVGAVLGATDVRLVRLSVERYAPGHFFGFAFGAPAGADVGFTIDLTPTWQPEWGGLLEFLNATGRIERVYSPGFNVLLIYALAQPRGISVVQPFSGCSRYSISGQLSVSWSTPHVWR